MASKYIQQNLTQLPGEIVKSTVIMSNLNSSLSAVDRTNKPKKSVKIQNIWTIQLINLT